MSALKSPLQRSRVEEENSLDIIVTGLLREHLHRKGLHSVLKLYDEETGYKGNHSDSHHHSSSTANLLKKFKLTSLYNRNQSSLKPLSSVLELVSAFFLHKLDPHTYTVEEVNVFDNIDSIEGQPESSETAAPATLFTEVIGVIPPPAPPETNLLSKSLENISEVTSEVSSSNPVMLEPKTDVVIQPDVIPILPVLPVVIAPPPQPPSQAPTTFFERLAARKADEATLKNNSIAVTSTETVVEEDVQIITASMKPTVTISPVPVITAPPIIDVQPVLPNASTTTAPSAPMTFFERLAAQKAAAAAAKTTGATTTTENTPTVAEMTTAPTTMPAIQSDVRAGMSFAERLAAQKSTSTVSSIHDSNTVVSSVVAPQIVVAPVVSAVIAPVSFAFTAPDGKGFATRDEYRKYMFSTFYSFSSRTGETLMKAPGTLDGQPFSMDDMKDCTIMLCDHSETVQVDRVTKCKILIAACCESVFLRNCTDCVIYVACKQLRTRDCVNCRVFLYSKTDPIIEASHTMLLAPFMASYPGLASHMKSAKLEPQYNHWKRIFDFSADDIKLPRPHWSIMDESEWGEEWIIEGIPGIPENPVPRDASPKDESALPEGFDIKKGPAAAESVLQKTAPVIVKPQDGGGGGGSAPSAPTTTTISAPPAPLSGNSFFARLAAKNREQT
jgi:hypothetical protein